MAETPKQISNVNTSASCATFWICWKSQNLLESVIDFPRLIELTVDEYITSYGCGNSGADLFVLQEINLIWENKEERRRYQGVMCSIYQSIKDH